MTTQREIRSGDSLRSRVAQSVTFTDRVIHGKTLAVVRLPTGDAANYVLSLPPPQESFGQMITVKAASATATWTNGTVTVEGKTLAAVGDAHTFLSIGDAWVCLSDIPSATLALTQAAADITELQAANILTFPAATGNIAANTIVTPTADTVCKWGYGSASVLGPLFHSSAGATAAADCDAVPWLSKPAHVCTATAAVIAIGDVVVLTTSGQVVKTSAGAGKVVIGKCTVACGSGGGDVTIAPCAPYLTLA
jgi:hypothetical protein